MHKYIPILLFLLSLWSPAFGSTDSSLTDTFKTQAYLLRNRGLQQLETKPVESKRLEHVLSKYLTNKELYEHLKEFANRCSHIARLSTFGKSVNGAPLYALEITERATASKQKPAVKLVGNIHGDEPTGRVFTLALAEWLCANLATDPDAKRIVSQTRLWLIPTLNPDGFASKSRYNARRKDLNRDFPDRFASPSMAPSGKEQPETVAMMQFSKTKRIVASLAFHEGALVANYPWDGTRDRKRRYEKCPDDATFIHLASAYAVNHRRMALPSNHEFPDGGITNGAAWYPIYGSMQDWNYLVAQCMELTIETSEKKWPAEEKLPTLWEDNLPAMLAFIRTAGLGGARGRLMAESAALRKDKGEEVQPLEADVSVEGSPFKVRSGPRGEYYRALAPGKYTLIIKAAEYPAARINVTVPTSGRGVVRDFVLRKGPKPKASSFNARKVLVSQSSLPLRYDGLVLVGVGGVVVYGLWWSHKRLGRDRQAINRAR
jgi:carboxypeptidase D